MNTMSPPNAEATIGDARGLPTRLLLLAGFVVAVHRVERVSAFPPLVGVLTYLPAAVAMVLLVVATLPRKQRPGRLLLADACAVFSVLAYLIGEAIHSGAGWLR